MDWKPCMTLNDDDDEVNVQLYDRYFWICGSYCACGNVLQTLLITIKQQYALENRDPGVYA